MRQHGGTVQWREEEAEYFIGACRVFDISKDRAVSIEQFSQNKASPKTRCPRHSACSVGRDSPDDNMFFIYSTKLMNVCKCMPIVNEQKKRFMGKNKGPREGPGKAQPTDPL